MDLQLAGKTALVSGGSRGLGNGVAQALAGEGVRVALLARDQGKLDTAVAEIRANGGDAIGVVADLNGPDAVERAFAEASAALGQIDILVNNSGGPPPSGVLGLDSNLWRTQFEQMVLAIFRMTDLAVPAMRERGWGRVLTIASSSVIEPIAALGVSNTLRSAIVGWSKTLAAEVGADGITVNMLLPGSIATDRVASLNKAAAGRRNVDVETIERERAAAIPVGRVGTTAEFGAVGAFLASPLAAYVTGSLIRIDGGMIRSV